MSGCSFMLNAKTLAYTNQQARITHFSPCLRPAKLGSRQLTYKKHCSTPHSVRNRSSSEEYNIIIAIWRDLYQRIVRYNYSV